MNMNRSESNIFSILPVMTGPVGAVATDPHDPSTVHLGGSQGLFRSTDSGQTWALLGQELRYPHVLLVDPFDGRRLYAARRDIASFLPLPGVYVSSDGGGTWSRYSAGLADERIFALAVDPHHRGVLYAGSWAGRVYRSTDGGMTWARPAEEPVRTSSRDAAGTVGQLVINPTDDALYALTGYVGTFRSDDGGMSWQQISTDAGWLAIDPQHGSLYLAGRRLQCSDSRGQKWIDLSAHLPCDPQTGAFATYWIGVIPEPLELYTRYHRSTDGGMSWEALEAPTAFLPRLLVPEQRAIYGSINGQAGRYRLAARTEEQQPPATWSVYC